MAKVPADALGRVQPQAVPLEEAVLGACLVDKGGFNVICEILNRNDPYVDAHKFILDSMFSLSAKGAPIDLLTVMEELRVSGKLDKVGGPAYLAELSNRVASAANIEYHARIIKQKSLARNLITAGQDLIRQAYEEDPLELLAAHHNLLTSFMDTKSSGVSSSAEVAKMAFEQYVKASERKGAISGQTLIGIPEVDDLWDGGEEGDSLYLGARPKHGKSSVAASIAAHFFEKDQPLYYHSGEMTKVNSFSRVLSGLTGIPVKNVMQGKALNDPLFEEAWSKLEKGKVWFGKGPMNVFTLRTHVTIHMNTYGTKVFMIDRLELFDEVANAKPGAENQARLYVTTAIRMIGDQTGACMIIVAQCNAGNEKTASKRPGFSNLYGATAIQSNCTKAILLYRPEEEGLTEFSGEHEGLPSKNKMEIYVGGGNSLPYKSVIVEFDGACCFVRGNERFNPALPKEGDLPF